MREPRPDDDATASTIDLVVRLKGTATVVDRLVDEAGRTDGPDAWFQAGLAAWAVMEVTSHSLRKHHLLMSALDHLSTAIELDPSHWPARFMRCTFVTMMHGDEADESVAFLLPAQYSAASGRQDAQVLVQLHREHGGRAAYGLSAYALGAVHELRDQGVPIAVRTLRDGLAATDPGSAPGLASRLCIPVAMVLDDPALRAPQLARLRSAVLHRYRGLAGSPRRTP